MIAPEHSAAPGMGYGSGKLGLEPASEVVETVGRLIEFWGFKRALGRVWAMLYLSPAPVSASEIGEQLAMSSGAVSMALNELQLWGVVSRVHKPGDRKEYFGAEEDIWKMVTRVLSDRELREVESAYDTFARAEQALAHQREDAAGESKEKHRQDLDFRRSRIAHLRKVAGSGKVLLQGLILTSKVDASPLKLLANLRKRNKGS